MKTTHKETQHESRIMEVAEDGAGVHSLLRRQKIIICKQPMQCSDFDQLTVA
jgi:hypothetical protein